MKTCIECGKQKATYWEDNFCDDCAKELFRKKDIVEQMAEIVGMERPAHWQVFKIKEILEGEE